MSDAQETLKGTVRNGVIEFEAPYPLPDGTEIEFVVTRHVFTEDERAEFEQWEKLGDEAWNLINWDEEDLAHTHTHN